MRLRRRRRGAVRPGRTAPRPIPGSGAGPRGAKRRPPPSARAGMAAGSPPLLYRSPRLLRAVFLQLHRQQQRDDVFCDVLLRAEGQAVPAHCCVLAGCSPFFMERLSRELPPRGRRVELELAGLKMAALRALLRFLYTAELRAPRAQARDVLAAARQLRVAELEALQLRRGGLVRPPPRRRPGPGSPRGRAGGTPRERPPPPEGSLPPGPPVGRLKLRRVGGRRCWEVVRDGEGPASRGGAEPWLPPPRPRGDGLEEEEEVDVGVVEPCPPPGFVCVWPSPSSESGEEVDVLG